MKYILLIGDANENGNLFGFFARYGEIHKDALFLANIEQFQEINNIANIMKWEKY